MNRLPQLCLFVVVVVACDGLAGRQLPRIAPASLGAGLAVLGGFASRTASQRTNEPVAADLDARQQRAYAAVAPAVVTFSFEGVPHGCGVIVSAAGAIVAMGHHERPSWSLLDVELADGRTTQARIRSVIKMRSVDASVLKIEDPGPWPFAPLGSAREWGVERPCLFLGHPGSREVGRPAVLRRGRLVAFDEDQLTTTVRIVPGDSGGPLFDLEGRVLGVGNSIGFGQDVGSRFTASDFFLAHWDRLLGEPTALPVGEYFPQVVATTGGVPAGRGLRDRIVAVECDGARKLLGTVMADGLIITKASELTGVVRCRLGRGEPRPARVVASSEEHDLALLACAIDAPAQDWTTATSDQITVARTVSAVGVDGKTLNSGILSTPVRAIPLRDVEKTNWQDESEAPLSGRRSGFSTAFSHDATIAPNECGSPLIDQTGRVLGINVARSRRYEVLAVPIDVALGLVNEAGH